MRLGGRAVTCGASAQRQMRTLRCRAAGCTRFAGGGHHSGPGRRLRDIFSVVTGTGTRQAFVITQLGEEVSEVRTRANDVLMFVIQPAACAHDLTLVRADQIAVPGTITEQIAQGIADAEVVIADVSGRNVNVYYELGLAHAWRKPTVLLVDVIASLPFDLSHERVISLGAGELAARPATEAVEALKDAITAVLAEDVPGLVELEVAVPRSAPASR